MEVSEAALGSASRIAAEVYLVGARVGVRVGARLRLRARARVRVRVRLRARVRDGVHPLKQPTSRHCYLLLLTTHYLTTHPLKQPTSRHWRGCERATSVRRSIACSGPQM